MRTVKYRSRRKLKSGENYIGFLATARLYNYINLYVLQDKKTKTEIIQPLLQKWYDKMIKEFPLETLINNISHQYQVTWNKKRKRCKGLEDASYKFEDYKEDIKKTLKKKKIEHHIVYQITNKLFM